MGARTRYTLATYYFDFGRYESIIQRNLNYRGGFCNNIIKCNQNVVLPRYVHFITRHVIAFISMYFIIHVVPPFCSELFARVTNITTRVVLYSPTFYIRAFRNIFFLLSSEHTDVRIFCWNARSSRVHSRR